MIHSYKELIVWQRAMELVAETYDVTEEFPKEETYGLVSQMHRAAVSIPSNIAEGRDRGTKKEFIQFLRIALGSTGELETQMEIAKMLPKTKKIDFCRSESLLLETGRMLRSMIQKLNPKSEEAREAR
jgi:four helix bundle protein